MCGADKNDIHYIELYGKVSLLTIVVWSLCVPRPLSLRPPHGIPKSVGSVHGWGWMCWG